MSHMALFVLMEAKYCFHFQLNSTNICWVLPICQYFLHAILTSRNRAVNKTGKILALVMFLGSEKTDINLKSLSIRGKYIVIVLWEQIIKISPAWILIRASEHFSIFHMPLSYTLPYFFKLFQRYKFSLIILKAL